MENLVNAHKYVFPQKSLLDELLVREFADGSFVVLSDITIMKELSGNPDKFTPAQVEAINARSTMRPPSYSSPVSDDQLMENIIPRDIQSLNEISAVNNYISNEVVNKESSERKERELNELRERILNKSSNT